MNDPARGPLTRIFLAAADLPEEERRAFLERECPDPEVRRQVERLLAYDDGDEQVRTGALAGLSVLPSPPPPESVGPYRIGDKLGEGGMGDVYRATQSTPVQREVAIKFLKPALATDAFVARFDSERQALASMSHPNIAQILDAGVSDDGRPFFAMEYIDGAPIHRYADRRRLTVRERLALFRQICAGVQHAHQKAVIHRDIKPANVLVAEPGGEPVPKVIDFGIAKPTDDNDTRRTMTRVGSIGTPDYMSPEQFRADGAVDTRTDVYQLGALLYELLTGGPPFHAVPGADTVGGIPRLILEDDPPLPSRRPRHDGIAGPVALRRDLDWIVMRALNKDPASRYDSPAELAADVQRYLDDKPVIAGPPSRTHRMRKFVRRHRLGVTLAASLALALIAATVASSIQARRIAAERDRANREAEVARQISDYVLGLFDLGDQTVSEQEMRFFEVLFERSMARIRTELADQPELQVQLMRSMAHGYKTYLWGGGLGYSLESVLDVARENLGPDHPATLEVGSDLVGLRRMAINEGLEPFLQETIARAGEVLGPDHSTTLRARIHLGRYYQEERRFDEADAILRDALDRGRTALGKGHSVTLRAAAVGGSNLIDAGRHADAERLLRTWHPTMRGYLEEYDNVLTMTEFNLACLYATRGERDRALHHLRAAVDGGFLYGRVNEHGEVVVGATGMLQEPLLLSLSGDEEMLRIMESERDLRRVVYEAQRFDLDAAVDGLRSAQRNGFGGTPILRWHPQLAALRSHPSFESLAAAIDAQRRGRVAPTP